MCDGTACRETCQTNNDCVAPNTCVGNVCGKKPAGAPCATSDQCSTGLSCTDGFCCNSANCGACRACNASGMCQNADGDACTAADMCHQTQGTCMAGACQRPNVNCDDGNPCTADGCSLTAGCTHTPIVGMACNDNNACTQTDACNAQGICAGSNPVTCAAPAQCKGPGVCTPATGTCTYPNLTGTPCTDNNACTTGDECQGGACMAGDPVTCPAPDQCHLTRVCDPGTGMCSNPPKPNTADCDDDNACTKTDKCNGAGACVGSNPVVCTASNQCHTAGTCDPQTGDCSNPPKANGADCDDGNMCTDGDKCQGGNCQPGAAVVCPGDMCHDAGACNPNNGNCSQGQKKDDGTGCNDNNVCTDNDVCMNGTCQGTPVEPGTGLCI
jgi:hypothetical protein